MFHLHPRLAADTAPVVDLDLCTVRLMEDAELPWLVLVPRLPDARELHHLSLPQRQQALEEVTRASLVLERLFAPDKLNIGALGNVVAQLHIHVVARWQGDRAWPGPIWGAGNARAYDPAVRAARCRDIAAALAA